METPQVTSTDMLITCFMPTYNRLRRREDGTIDARLIEESIESFVRQTYPNKELIILNDTPGQNLRLPCDSRYEQIRIINHPTRFESLAHKYRYAIDRADGEYFTPWDDDDISLPSRITTCRQYLQGAEVLQVHGFYFIEPDGTMSFNHGDGYMMDFYQVELSRRLGYALPDDNGQGSDARTRALFSAEASNVKHISPSPDWHFYIYRWATTHRLHISGFGNEARGYQTIGQQLIEPVDYLLQPAWYSDYTAMARKFAHGNP